MNISCERAAHFGGTEFQRSDAENRFKIVQKLKCAEGPRQMLTFLFCFIFLYKLCCVLSSKKCNFVKIIKTYYKITRVSHLCKLLRITEFRPCESIVLFQSDCVSSCTLHVRFFSSYIDFLFPSWGVISDVVKTMVFSIYSWLRPIETFRKQSSL